MKMLRSNIGHIYHVGGHGVEKDTEKVLFFEHFQKSADLGGDVGQCNLGVLFSWA